VLQNGSTDRGYSTGRKFIYIPLTALNHPLISPMGLPEPSIALARQATAHSPTRAEAAPMVMMLPLDTVSMAALEDSWVCVWDLLEVAIFFLLECEMV
jgi:hypothetical protein